MAFRDFKEQKSVEMLQRSLQRGRLGHAYLFAGHDLELLEGVAVNLVKTLTCENPVRREGRTTDCCDICEACRRVDQGAHSDLHWVRPESKSRVITAEQMREFMREIQLKARDGGYKAGIIVAADRFNDSSANAFLKTLEEPPASSVMILTTTEPQRILDTILSRCLRLTFGGGSAAKLSEARRQWLEGFSAMAAGQHKSLLSRYQLLDLVLQELTALRTQIEENLTERSPIQKHPDAEKNLIEKWEDELKAAIEAEFRHQRADLLATIQWWLRDAWLHALKADASELSFGDLRGAEAVGARISAKDAMHNLEVLEEVQTLLQNTNVQEALALEVNLLKLKL